MTDSRDQHETYAHTQASFLVRMKEQINRLTAERDEARREVCVLKSANFEHRIGPVSYAMLRDWNCFEVTP